MSTTDPSAVLPRISSLNCFSSLLRARSPGGGREPHLNMRSVGGGVGTVERREKVCLDFKIFKQFLMFLYLQERQRGRTWAGEGQREEDPESEAGSRLRAVSTEPDVELEPPNLEIMTWAEVGRLTHWATQVPCDLFLCLFGFGFLSSQKLLEPSICH